MDTKKYFLKVIGAFLCNQPIPLCPDNLNINKLYNLAFQNSVQGIMYLIAKKTDIPFTEEMMKNLETSYMTHLVRDVSQKEVMDFIRYSFKEKSIDFMLLKGSHLKKLYPISEVRFMADMDVLVHEKDIESATQILTSYGFEIYLNNGKDIVFTKEPCLTLELHKMLFIEDFFMHDYFTGVWERAESVGNHEYKMSYNDLYVYTLSHLAEHYMGAGSCFRPAMDLFLMEYKLGNDIDFEYIDKQFRQIGIIDFAKKMRVLCNCMFSDGEYDEDLDIMENYIVLGAPVKNAEAAAKAASTKKSKGRQLFEALFPNFSHMKTRYPLLQKLPVLLPLFWLIRIVTYIFTKNKTVISKRKQLQGLDKESAEIMQQIFEKSGL